LRSIPVLLLTARAGEEATLEGLEAGADDYVEKPFGPEELRRRIENHLSARRHLEARYREEVSIEALGAVVESEERPFVERVLEAAGGRLSNPDFGVGDLAEAMALSRRQLTRRLKRAVGEPPGQVLRRLRIERGKRLLREGAETVSEVAYAAGFRSPSAFSHAFGEVVGCTPTEFVEERDEGQNQERLDT
ncbi:MAG TPA: helix-turn-helix domain-containing protein, partial [Salinibacter sp.]|nr:helix-turn-helix domain-containing protein [Salinibacter sp.]